MLYIPFGRVKSDPEGVIRHIEVDLGLSRFEKYPKLTHQVNASKKKTEVDEEILSIITDMTAAQYPFLKNHFGEKFFNQIK